MPKASRASARPSARLAALLALILLATLAPAGSGTLAAVKVTAGWRDFSYAQPAAPGADDVTADRSQSKLWFHDGRWFGILFDPASTPNAKFRIWRFDMATQNWTNTTIAVDDRNRSHADVLSLGNTIYVASARAEGPVGTTGRDLRIYKYTYNATSKTYAPVTGFPKTVPSTAAGTGYATMALDGTNRLWVAFTQAATPGATLPTDPAKVKVSSSTDVGGTWSAPIDLPNMGNSATNDDVAAIASLAGGVGVLFSNQAATDDAFYFVPHVNGQAVGTWGARETAFGSGANDYDADGHISLKTDAFGSVLAAIKTGRNDDPAPNGGDPLIAVLKRSGAANVAGSWASHEVTDVTTEGTRPMLVLDAATNTANVFLTHPDTIADGPLSIFRRSAPLATLDFGAPSLGQLFISSATPTENGINDATSTKQMTTAASGILVEATNIPTLTYFHGCAGGPCPATPVANFTATPTSGTAPLNVQFTDTSTGNPTSWSWNFGDGTAASTARNPSHAYANPGTYTVTLTATNSLGSDAETKAGYITVAQPPLTVYNTIAPVRVLDSRPGINKGLAGAFAAKVPRRLSIAGANTIPGDATAITGNLTVVGQTRAGYLSITKASTSNPPSSVLNFPLGDTRANGVTLPLNADGDVWIVYMASGGTAHVLLDVTGYFRPSTIGTTFTPVPPVRVLDSRPGINKGLSGAFEANKPRTLSIAGSPGISPNARAITGNLTVVGQTRAGYLSITPNSTATPTTSTLNFPLADTRANGVTVPLNGQGDLSIVYKASGGTTHVILDVTGYFLDGTAGKVFVPVDGSRILDTRFNVGLPNKFFANQARTFSVHNKGGVGTTAVAIIGNVTVVDQSRAGYVSLTPTLQANPTTSTINFPLGDTRANNFTGQLSGANMSGVYKAASGSTHLIVDVFGYYK